MSNNAAVPLEFAWKSEVRNRAENGDEVRQPDGDGVHGATADEIVFDVAILACVPPTNAYHREGVRGQRHPAGRS